MSLDKLQKSLKEDKIIINELITKIEIEVKIAKYTIISTILKPEIKFLILKTFISLNQPEHCLNL